MTVAEGVRARLLAITAVTALVGTRVYVLTFPQKPTYPAIRVVEVSGIEDYHLRGSVGIRRARIQVDVVSPSYTAASALMDAVHGSYAAGLATGLTGFSGTVGGSTGMTICGIFSEGVRELFDPDELSVARLSHDYAVFWRQG